VNQAHAVQIIGHRRQLAANNVRSDEESANLQEVDLIDADLHGADLSRANLRRAILLRVA
jgi:uncharacterized protein YjbI with pentapeptide repeats